VVVVDDIRSTNEQADDRPATTPPPAAI